MSTTTTGSRTAWFVALIVWAAAALGVWAWTTSYQFQTYEPSPRFTDDHWPDGSSLRLAGDRPTLVLLMHPRCPCTRASIRELERVLTGRGLSASQLPKVIVLATVPANASAEWRDADVVRSALRLPRVELTWDVEGRESSRFGAVASGTVMLYGPDGKRLFAGGVTSSRGHEGGNAGSEQVHALLAETSLSTAAATPVFGCRLCDGGPPAIGGQDVATNEGDASPPTATLTAGAR